jgi:hypothetical protein
MTKESGFDSWYEYDIFLFFTGFRPAPGPTQPYIQWAPGGGVKRNEHEANHSPPFIEEMWSYTTPHTSS